jgi:hypothetical protein
MTRGLVVPLTTEQIIARAKYLARLVGSTALDSFARAPRPLVRDIYYRLPDHNGGTDPTAPDCATDWFETDVAGVVHPRITSDCSGADSWIHGHDRYQPQRMAAAVGYGGFWNTNSKIIDAERSIVGHASGARCFEAEATPRAGLIVVCKSGSPGHAVGHEETIYDAPAWGVGGVPNWDPRDPSLWAMLRTSGCRGHGPTANGPSTARGWYGTGALFLRSAMQP